MAQTQGARGTRLSSKDPDVRLLVVDDQPAVTELVQSALRDGFQVTCEQTPIAALETLETGDFDCIVSDYRMPVMDGLEFLDAVRERHPDLPFILYTGQGSESVASEAIQSGATDYIRKDTGHQWDLLENRVRNAVEQYRATQAERHLRELAETTDRILYIFNHDWTELLFVSPAYEDIWGRSLETLQENPTDFLNGIHPDDREMVQRNMAEMSEGGTITIEYRVNEDSDYSRWVRVRGEPIVENGAVVRVAGFATEITEEKRRRRELDHKRSVLESVVETVPFGVLVVDTDREFSTYNRAFVEMWGLPPDVVASEDDEKALESVLDTVDEPDEFLEQVQYFYDHPAESGTDQIPLTDGRIFERYTGPVVGPEDTYYGRVWVFRDVTERERREARLERKNDRLDRFASIVSHDLRNPMSVAEGWVTMEQEERESERLERSLEAFDRMDELISDLLTLARTGQEIEATETLSLEEVAEESWFLVQTDDADLHVTDDASFGADPQRIQQVFENLFRNAVEHGSTSPGSQSRQDAVEHGSTSPGSQAHQDAVEHGSTSPGSQSRQDAVEHAGTDVTITVGPLETGTGFFVEDDGSGIPPDDRESVFEPGYTTHDDGTGFGLVIVQEIADAHGWTVTVTNGEDGGARFEFTGVDLSGDSAATRTSENPSPSNR